MALYLYLFAYLCTANNNRLGYAGYNIPSTKPFVKKWVGGKTQLLKDIKHALPVNLAQTKDILCGTICGRWCCAILDITAVSNIKRAVINDINPI